MKEERKRDITIVTGATARDFLWKYSCTKECSICFSYVGSKTYFLSVLRMIWIKLHFPFEVIWYNRKVLRNKGTLVVFETNISIYYLNWLISHSNAERFIFYYWNTYREGSLPPDDIRRLGYEVWSFDQNDCLKYNMRYNPQMFFHSWYKNIDKDRKKILYDVVFVGRDKFGRMEQMQKILELFKEKKINYHIHFVARKWYQRFKSFHYSKYLNFQEMIGEEMKGKVVLDFCVLTQSGLSLRVYDALYNCRKIITNNSAIKTFDFYSKENVFILGEDDEQSLIDFIHSDFLPIDNNILQRYSIKGWLERFEGIG